MKETADPDALDHSTKLAFDRTWLAEERTMLAWVRTATSLISFGFAIYSFFGIPTGAGHQLTSRRMGPQVFSVTLIVMGLLTLIGSVLQRRQALAMMRVQYPGLTRFSMAEIIALLIGCLGLFALAVLLLRL
jgi:putative membrane protein